MLQTQTNVRPGVRCHCSVRVRALQLPPWTNPWLLGAIALSLALHAFILYVPPAAALFSVVPLSGAEWGAVVWLSFPVILVDEVLKYLTRSGRKPLTLNSLTSLSPCSWTERHNLAAQPSCMLAWQPC